MPHTTINKISVDQIVAHIQRRLQSRSVESGQSVYDGPAFEWDVRELLERLFPYSVLSGLRLFSPTNRIVGGSLTAAASGSEEATGDGNIGDVAIGDRGFEMDHLLHFRTNGDDFVVVIEVKAQEIVETSGNWMASYRGKPKNAREQVNNHIKVLWEYLEPISRQINLRFIGIVCCEKPMPPMPSEGYRNAALHLCGVTQLPGLLEDLLRSHSAGPADAFEVFRVRESGFLSLLRQGLPVQELGHPELSNAVRYVQRCRRTIDGSLFQHFEPSTERWVINGSAGMGKSVLLAYTAAVLTTGHGLGMFHGEAFVHPEKKLERLQLKLDSPDQAIIVMAMSGKQLENLKAWYARFIERFRELDTTGQLRVRQPEFVLCRDRAQVRAICARASVLMVDEAHDLKEFAAKEISEGHSQRGMYLVVACDRHQKLKLSKDDTRIIKGLDFTNKSKRLSQIYRNPAPVYLASLALMFRWGARTGPKVVPTWTELREGFGFDVKSLAGQGHVVSIMSDAHPANSWSHSVVLFPSVESLYGALAAESLSGGDVLWVRFSEEDPDFNYEQLSRFTYHNCRTHEAHDLSDKYVKGQEFPVVVIEGFPGFVDRYGTEADEAKMWAFRREIYLCASRATCFLYFVCNPRMDTEENLRFRQELKTVIDEVALPRESNGGGTRKWALRILQPSENRKLEVFEDTRFIEPETGLQAGVTGADNNRQESVDPVPPVGGSASQPGSPPEEVPSLSEPPQAVEAEVLPDEELLVSKPVPKPPKKVSPWIYSELTPAQLATLPALETFQHAITVPRRVSVMDLARKLGVHHRDVITDGSRLGLSLRGGTTLGPELTRRIAAAHAFGIELEEDPEEAKP